MTETDDIRAIAIKALALDALDTLDVAELRELTRALAKALLARLDEPRSAGVAQDERVTHDDARSLLDSIDRGHPLLNDELDDLRIYVAQHAELERRARELCEAVRAYAGAERPTPAERTVLAMRVVGSNEQLADLLGIEHARKRVGEERSGSAGGGEHG